MIRKFATIVRKLLYACTFSALPYVLQWRAILSERTIIQAWYPIIVIRWGQCFDNLLANSKNSKFPYFLINWTIITPRCILRIGQLLLFRSWRWCIFRLTAYFVGHHRQNVENFVGPATAGVLQESASVCWQFTWNLILSERWRRFYGIRARECVLVCVPTWHLILCECWSERRALHCKGRPIVLAAEPLQLGEIECGW